jgi:hypothetical protein
MLIFLTSISLAGTIDLPQTGQTKCYHSTGGEIACSGTGQDGEIQAGVPWPDPRFTDNGDDTVTDNLTGLMWTKNANLPAGTRTWQDALGYIAGMNAGTYPNFGYTDWRLPNVNELESLINANESNNATWLNTQGLLNVQADYYWSSTTFAYNPGGAWIVDMWDGHMGANRTSDGNVYVWPVRAGQSGSFISASANCEWRDTFNIGETVYGYATLGLAPNTSYPLHVLDDRSDWSDGMDIPTSCTQCATAPATSFTTDAYGDMPCGTIIWQNLQANVTSAAFDIIIDVNSNGKFDFSTDFIDSMSVAGFVTLVKLTSFEAIPGSNHVILKWVTESEIDNAGFNLYRAESEDGEYVKINDSLIPAEGAPTQGVSYQFIDEGVKNRTTYYYKLEDIDLYGTSTMHGPVGVTPRGIYGIER